MNRKNFFVAGLVLSAFVLLATPALSHAATYAYVNMSNDVATVEAADPNTAIRIAPGIHPRSGVLLLKTAADFTIVQNN
jgi:hypothetical protein